MDGSECRKRADACAELAQKVEGKKRNDLLDMADSWDVLAEENDALESEELAIQAAKEGQAEPKRVVLHLPAIA